MSDENLSETSIPTVDNRFAASPASSNGGVKTGGLGIKAIKSAGFTPVAFVIIGVVCVYGLHLRSGPATASAEQQLVESEVDIALLKIDVGAINKRTKSGSDNGILDTFHYEARQRQIPLSHLISNPFVFESPRSSLLQGLPEFNQNSKQYNAIAQDLTEAMEAVKQLKLQSILTNQQKAMAMISHNLIAEGGIINGWTVKSIKTREVVLQWRDRTYILEMSH